MCFLATGYTHDKMAIRTVAIVGSGAVGIYYGCRIQETGREVRFLLRTDYEQVRERGFVVKSVAGDMINASPQVFKSTAAMGAVDLVVVCWKATSNKFAKEVITPLLQEGTRILTLQNGLGNVEYLEGLFGKGRVLGGLCFVGINRIAAGHIDHQGGGMITIGEFHPTGVLSEMEALFGARVQITTVAELGAAQWRKLVWNIPFNGLCVTEGGIDTQELLSVQSREEQVRVLMREVIDAAGALGHEMPYSLIEDQIARTHTMGRYRPSTMLDYVAGNAIEVESIWGEALKRAQEANLAMPHLAKLTDQLRKLNQGR